MARERGASKERELRKLAGLIDSEDVYELEDRLRPLLEAGTRKPPPGVSPGTPTLRFKTPESTAWSLGYHLVDLDRELRRAAAFVSQPGRYTDRAPRPRGPAALEVVSFARGSADVLLIPIIGGITQILLSDPIQLALTLSWFWEHRPAMWGLKRPSHPTGSVEILEDLNRSARKAIRKRQPVEFDFEEATDDRKLKVRFRS